MQEISLSKKKILYIGPSSFHYDKCLIAKLEERGAAVTSHDLLTFYSDNLFFRAYIKFNPKKKFIHRDKFYRDVFLKDGYDYVLVRHGYQLDASFLEKLHKVNPNATFINFHWDSIRPEYDYIHLIKYYDKVFSFDVKDCRDHPQVKYLPLYYLDIYKDFRKKDFDNFKPKPVDLLFIGAWRDKERYNLIVQTEELCKKMKLKFKHYLLFSLKRHFYSIKKGIIPKKARMRQLSHKQILDMFATTNVIIDFPSSFQTGMTIRTFETLGSGKKLITTNRNIVNEPFYNPEYINIIDINNIILDIDFIKKVPVTSMEDKIKDYSLDSYVNKLFS